MGLLYLIEIMFSAVYSMVAGCVRCDAPDPGSSHCGRSLWCCIFLKKINRSLCKLPSEAGEWCHWPGSFWDFFYVQEWFGLFFKTMPWRWSSPKFWFFMLSAGQVGLRSCRFFISPYHFPFCNSDVIIRFPLVVT
jgi:hypothetical protein